MVLQYFFYKKGKGLKSISNEWLNANCQSSPLFGIFIKGYLEFSLIFFGTAKKDCVIKTRGMFSFLPMINN